jgi:hypothetical protein
LHEDLKVSDFDSDLCKCKHEAGKHFYDCCSGCGPARCDEGDCECVRFVKSE